MPEHPLTGFHVESTDRSSEYEALEAAMSLRRYKETPAYRIQLLRATLNAAEAELRATTPIEKAKVRLSRLEAEAELSYLKSGGRPSAMTGFISLRPELSRRLRAMS